MTRDEAFQAAADWAIAIHESRLDRLSQGQVVFLARLILADVAQSERPCSVAELASKLRRYFRAGLIYPKKAACAENEWQKEP